MTKTEKLIIAIGVMAMGILFILLTDKFIGILMTIAGGSLIALGVVELFYRRVARAVIKLVSGLLLVICGWALVEAVLYILAGVLLVVGILAVYDKIKNGSGCTTFWRTLLSYVLPVIGIVIGVSLLFQGLVDVGVLLVISGVLLIVAGVSILIEALLAK